jgi:DNA-binding response OmpR family regulator
MEAYSPGELATLAQRPVRILVVDENVQEQQLLRLKMEALGAAMILVRHGRVGIMTAQKTLPDIVILDLGTTDIPGLEVLRHLKSVKRTSGIPVICLSSSRDESYRLRTLRMNADWYLSKPFKFSEMMARLRYHAQEIASRTVLRDNLNADSLRKSVLRSAADTLSDTQDIRKALHGLKGYVGADDYYLNNKLESCFRNLTRIENRLKEFREWTGRPGQPRPTGAAPIALGAPHAQPGGGGGTAEGPSAPPASAPGLGSELLFPGEREITLEDRTDGGDDGTQGRDAV